MQDCCVLRTSAPGRYANTDFAKLFISLFGNTSSYFLVPFIDLLGRINIFPVRLGWGVRG